MDRLFHRLVFAAALALAGALAGATAAHAADFLKAIEDVPLPKGLAEQAEPVVFESDQGRVVKTVAEGQIGAPDIEMFYLRSLPALGWRRVANARGLSFERESERLNIAIAKAASDAPARVSFELIVRLASTRLQE